MLQTQAGLCHVKIENTANSPKKVTRHAVYTCCTLKGCNIVYTYMYKTAANKSTPNNKVYTTQEVGWVLSNKSLVYEFFLVHLAYIHYTLKLLEQLEEWIDVLGSRSKVVIRFYL